MNSQFHFGASTRNYILRERPTTASSRTSNIMEDIPMNETTEGLLGLPESQPELDVKNQPFIYFKLILLNFLFSSESNRIQHSSQSTNFNVGYC